MRMKKSLIVSAAAATLFCAMPAQACVPTYATAKTHSKSYTKAAEKRLDDKSAVDQTNTDTENTVLDNIEDIGSAASDDKTTEVDVVTHADAAPEEKTISEVVPQGTTQEKTGASEESPINENADESKDKENNQTSQATVGKEDAQETASEDTLTKDADDQPAYADTQITESVSDADESSLQGEKADELEPEEWKGNKSLEDDASDSAKKPDKTSTAEENVKLDNVKPDDNAEEALKINVTDSDDAEAIATNNNSVDDDSQDNSSDSSDSGEVTEKGQEAENEALNSESAIATASLGIATISLNEMNLIGDDINESETVNAQQTQMMRSATKGIDKDSEAVDEETETLSLDASTQENTMSTSRELASNSNETSRKASAQDETLAQDKDSPSHSSSRTSAHTRIKSYQKKTNNNYSVPSDTEKEDSNVITLSNDSQSNTTDTPAEGTQETDPNTQSQKPAESNTEVPKEDSTSRDSNGNNDDVVNDTENKDDNSTSSDADKASNEDEGSQSAEDILYQQEGSSESAATQSQQNTKNKKLRIVSAIFATIFGVLAFGSYKIASMYRMTRF